MEFTLKTVYLSAMANFPPDLESQTFREAFCEKFGCARDFPECAFRQSLHLHARCLAPLIRVFSPDFFKEDLEAIVEMGNARTLRSEEHTSELQSRFGISYAVFSLKKK